MPLIAPGVVLTVTVNPATQPEPRVYAIIEVPVVSALTMPLDDPMVATVVLLLVQVPPLTELLNVVVVPSHKLVEPVIAPGVASTVMVIVVGQADPTK